MSHDSRPNHSDATGDSAGRTTRHRAELERLARCAADGELAVEDAARYESAKAADPTLARFEQSERELHQAVGRCMGDGYDCPKALRDRVAAMVAQQRAQATKPPAAPLRLSGTPTDTQPESTTTTRFPMWQRAVAFAAAVVIVVAVSSYFRQNPAAQQQGGPGIALAGDVPSGVQLAGFMSDEHNRCATHPTSIRKFTEQDFSRVPVAFQDVLGQQVQPQDLLPEGATFIAAGKCKVPGKGPSIHMMYEAFNQDGQPVEVSLYIQRCGDARFEPGKAYAVGAKGDTDAKSNIIGWRHGELLYYLVTSSPDITRNMAGQMSAPEVSGAI